MKFYGKNIKKLIYEKHYNAPSGQVAVKNLHDILKTLQLTLKHIKVTKDSSDITKSRDKFGSNSIIVDFISKLEKIKNYLVERNGK